MIKTFAKYSAGLIAGYLVLHNWTGFTKDINASSSGAGNLIQKFQGR